MAKQRKIELLVAYDDRTWDTEIFDTSATSVKEFEKTGDARVFDKLIEGLMTETRFRKVIGMYVYHVPSEDFGFGE